MKNLALMALALVAGLSGARAAELTVAQVDQIETLPCSIFEGRGPVSFKEGIVLTLPISKDDNGVLFARLADRLNECRNMPVDVSLAERR